MPTVTITPTPTPNATATASANGKQTFDDAYAAGQAQANQLFADGSMGRVDAGRSADTADLLARYRAGLNGYSDQEMQAKRELADGEINRNTQTSLRQLRGIQGASGVRGATAGAQQANVLNIADRNKQDYERQLMLDDMAARRAGLDSYGNALNNAQDFERQGQEFNIGQQNKEQYGRAAFPFQYAGMQQGFITDAQNTALQEQNNQAASDYYNMMSQQYAAGKNGSSASSSGGTYPDNYDAVSDPNNPMNNPNVQPNPSGNKPNSPKKPTVIEG